MWGIALVAAMGGLLFGYDWVVIGGAKPFYEVYFHLDTQQLVGWANSCALIGCFVGALAARSIAAGLGRKPALLLSAFLFALSSILTGWSHVFSLFVVWRILGGVAIGLASNISPLYIAEESPSRWRGRLVSLNQLALVSGILAAQIANWTIARPVAEHADGASIAAIWNVLYRWRWMFTAVAISAVIYFVCTLWIPESPRLMMRELPARAGTQARFISTAASALPAPHSCISSFVRRQASHSNSLRRNSLRALPQLL